MVNSSDTIGNPEPAMPQPTAPPRTPVPPEQSQQNLHRRTVHLDINALQLPTDALTRIYWS